MGALQQFIRFLLPQEGHFFGYLADAAVAADDAAGHFVELCRAEGRDQQTILVERVRDAENAGDRAKKDMSDALDRTFVTPIDREDLFHLMSTLEGLSDVIAATANQVVVHQMESLPLGSKELADTLKRATAELRAAVPWLGTPARFEDLKAACLRVALLENESDVIFRLRVGDMFAQEKDAIRLIKHKEFLEGLERSVDECAHVATYLEAVLIKNA